MGSAIRVAICGAGTAMDKTEVELPLLGCVNSYGFWEDVDFKLF